LPDLVVELPVTMIVNGAPVDHRQPRADQVPPEKNRMDPNNPLNHENVGSTE